MKLSIIILNHNTRDLLRQTLDSIHTDLKHEIIVVDNASTDGSTEMIRLKYPGVQLILSDKNIGFAAGNNLGLHQARGQYLLTLNSDTQIVTDALERLVAYLDHHPDVGIITPKLVLSDGAIDLSCHRGFPTLGNSIAYFVGLESLLPDSKLTAGYHQTWQDFTTIHQVDAVSGAAMMFRRSLLKEVGYLDEQFFMYAEDIDFCLRAKKAGWQVVFYPAASIIHFKGASGTKSTNQRVKSITRSHFYTTMKQYFAKHHQYPKPVQALVNLGIDFLAKIRK